MKQHKTLSWNDKLAIIDHFHPSDKEITTVFGVSQDELDTARELQKAGVMVPTPDIDAKSYSSIFSRKTGSSATSIVAPTKNNAPQTASPKVRTPKKRGRKGNKIAIAFKAIPTQPTPVVEFANKNNVSVAVLRQSKRFDTSSSLGAVHVKKDKSTNNLMIWREKPAKS